ncbi:nucleoside-diphosphate kinase [bacterium]|nr:nucleoside-diphosphate kinase [bacterium]MBU2599749.1 nucleoside-diphosphate kinase [bacterium]
MIKPEGIKKRRKILEKILPLAKIITSKKYPKVPLEKIAKLYEEHKDEVFYPWFFDYYQNKSIEVMTLEEKDDFQYKEGFFAEISKIVGDTDPQKAEKGTIRSMSKDSMENSLSERRILKNLVHRSKNKEDAQKEIKIFFDNFEEM